MSIPTNIPRVKGFRFPREIVGYAVWVSHRPTRKREKIFGKFKSRRQAQRFLFAHDQSNLIVRPRRYQLTAISYHHARSDAFSLWAGYTVEMAV